MPPPRRPRDRLARALRATADRLSAPGSPSSPDGAPLSSDLRGSPEDVPRPPGQPPEHWRRLVAAHAPGLLRDLPPPAAPPPPSAPPPLSEERAQARRWRAWKARLINRLAASGNDPSRSWYERAPIGAVSYQDLPGVLERGTGIPGSGKAERGRGATSPWRRAASTWAGAEWEAGGAVTSAAVADAGSYSDSTARVWDTGSLGDRPAGRDVAESGGAAGAPELTGTASISDGTGSPNATGTTDTTRTTDASGASSTRRPTVTRAPRPATTGARGASGANGARRVIGASNMTGAINASGMTGAISANGASSSNGGTGRPTEPGPPTGTGGPAHLTESRDTIGVTSRESDRPSPPERADLGADRVGALRNPASAGRDRNVVAGTSPSPSRDDVLPLLLAAAQPDARQAARSAAPPDARPGPGTPDGGDRFGLPEAATQKRGRAAEPYPEGPGPATDGDRPARQRHRPESTPSGPWPALPDDASRTRTAPAAAHQAAEGGGIHADPWPALPGEPAWWSPATRATPWSDTARLDREQAGD